MPDRGVSWVARGPSEVGNPGCLEGRSYSEFRDEACTQWASGWLAFQRKVANAYPSLDLNFDIPSDEEAEESFSADCSGEPNTPAKARSPSSPSAPTSALDV